MGHQATTLTASAAANVKIELAVAGVGSVTGRLTSVFPFTASITTMATAFGIHASISYLCARLSIQTEAVYAAHFTNATFDSHKRSPSKKILVQPAVA